MTAPTRFGIIRHARSDWNLTKKIQGRADRPLAPLGRQQARLWAEYLQSTPWDRIVASKLTRARQTAELIAEHLRIPVSLDSRLQEQDWGQWTGLTIKQIKADHRGVFKAQQKAGWHFCPPGGESRRQVLQRSRAALADAAGSWPGHKILVVTHQGPIVCLIYALTHHHFALDEPEFVQPDAMHWLTQTSSGLALEKFNDAVLPQPSQQTDTKKYFGSDSTL